MQCEDIFLSALFYTRYGLSAIRSAGTIEFRPPTSRLDYTRMLRRTIREIERVRTEFPELAEALDVLDRPILDEDAANLALQIANNEVDLESGWPRLESTKGGRPLI